jgi:hypothetical protein
VKSIPLVNSDLRAERLYAVGDIARELGVDLHRVLYLLRSRDIQPVCKIGSNRAYSADAVRLVERELQNDLRRRLF